MADAWSPCCPHGSPDRQTGTDMCCVSQQHNGDDFRCPSFASEKENERSDRSRGNPSGLRGGTDPAHSLCLSHLLCGAHSEKKKFKKQCTAGGKLSPFS